jgi:hypothetical protein
MESQLRNTTVFLKWTQMNENALIVLFEFRNYSSSPSSIGTTTVVGFGLLDYR